MNPTFRLGGSILIGQTDESSLALRGIIEPGGLISLKLKVDEFGRSILGDGDGVFGIADGGVSLGVEGVVGDFVFGDVVECVLEGPVGDGVAFGESSSDGCVFELEFGRV